MGEGGPVKVCAGCGADVSGSPRVKDGAGRYFCAGCAERLRQQAGAGVQPPAQFRGLAVCPGCGSSVPHGAVVCVQCGMNQTTGEKAATVLSGPEPEPVYADPMKCERCGERLKSVSKRACRQCGHKNRKLSARERGKAFSALMLRDELRRCGVFIAIGVVLSGLAAVLAARPGEGPLLAIAESMLTIAGDAAIGMLLYMLVTLVQLGVGDAYWLVSIRMLVVTANMQWLWLILAVFAFFFGFAGGGLASSFVTGPGLILVIVYMLMVREMVARSLDLDWEYAMAFAIVWTTASAFAVGPLVALILSPWLPNP